MAIAERSKSIPLSPDERKKIGERIRAFRTSAGITQQALLGGEKSDQVRQSKLERGMMPLTMPLLEIEADALRKSLEEIFGRPVDEVLELANSNPWRYKPNGNVRISEEERIAMRSLREGAGMSQWEVLGDERKSQYSRIETGEIKSAPRRMVAEINLILGMNIEIPEFEEVSESTVAKTKAVRKVAPREPENLETQEERIRRLTVPALSEMDEKPDNSSSPTQKREAKKFGTELRRLGAKLHAGWVPLFPTGEGSATTVFLSPANNGSKSRHLVMGVRVNNHVVGIPVSVESVLEMYGDKATQGLFTLKQTARSKI